MSKTLTSADPPAAPSRCYIYWRGAFRVLDAARRGGEDRPAVVRGNRRRAAATARGGNRTGAPRSAPRARIARGVTERRAAVDGTS